MIAFALGKYEVTREEYQAFVDATGHKVSGCQIFKNNKVLDDSTKNWRDPGYSQQGNHPVACVSWEDASAYVQWLAMKTGFGFRLPTEAQWEYAARAGTTTKYSWGKRIGLNNANCQGCGSQWDYKQTAPVGSFPANALGLHDIHGNLWEWVADCYQGSYSGASATGAAHQSSACSNRVLRGGSWFDRASWARSAVRGRSPAASRRWTIGFRVAQDL